MAKQTEFAKKAMEAAIANTRDIAELVQKSSGEAFRIVQDRMINYPFFKTLCNRTFHLLVKLLLVWRVHDISNNLKLYRTEVFRSIEIEERHFAANAELGLKPFLAGYDIEEVPISWINRTLEMGNSSFRIVKVAPNYIGALTRAVALAWRGKRLPAKRSGRVQPPC